MKPAKQPSLLLGAHFSIAKGLHKAILEAETYKCNTLQIFTKNAQTWKEKSLTEKEIKKFNATKEQTGIFQIISHTSYLINIAGPDKKKADMSCDALKQEIIRCGQLDIPYIVLHPGAHMGEGAAKGIKRIADNINFIFESTTRNSTRLLLETTAGQGTSIGHTFEQLAAIMDNVSDKTRIGVCLDTCHIFAAGYDISTKTGYEHTIRDFDDIISLKNLFVIHLNDTKKGCGTRVDRHEHIGDGFIGLDAFKFIINDSRLKDIPKILETPKLKNEQDADTINLELLRNIQLSSECRVA
ncbi:MAG: deoxyribonuclease IV [Desulfobacteraceae bacterium]|nr:deoxyribonuclease IV [Desulfobacteraceae bacterium]MBC2754671.1 deoxyribonuclease IV [Desulfobacteraceae bacterium]